MQLHNITGTPQQLFDKDLLHQCKLWRKSGKRIILLMDANEHVLNGKFNRQISRTGLDLEEFTHKCWGAHQPYAHINGSIPIDGGYKSPEIEVLNVCMLPFLDSPGDHRAFIIDISTRSLLGEFQYKVCRPISRCLIMSQQGSVDEYNRIVHEQFDQHRIVIRLDAVDKMTRYCGFPTPNFLRAMIIKLYRQMTEIRIHAEKKCRKILRPDSDYSPTVQMWYDRIHAYLQLIRLKEGKAKNVGNAIRFAVRTSIQTPDKLTMEELKDGLQYCQIRKAELRNQAKGLRKVHLQDCLIDAETKKQRDCVRDIKQTINREESKRMWSHSPSVLKVQRVIDGETKDYSIQEDVENAIKRECKIRFSLTHSVPIAGVCLVEKLRAIQLYEADFNCFNYFIFGRSAMDSLTKNDYHPEELLSQKGSTAEDAKFDKTLIYHGKQDTQ